MRLKLVLLTTAVAFGLGTAAALAEDAPGAKSDITIATENQSGADVPGALPEGKSGDENPGALPAPQQDENAPGGGGTMNEPSEDSGAATTPGKSGEAEQPPDESPGKGAEAAPSTTPGEKM